MGSQRCLEPFPFSAPLHTVGLPARWSEMSVSGETGCGLQRGKRSGLPLAALGLACEPAAYLCPLLLPMCTLSLPLQRVEAQWPGLCLLRACIDTNGESNRIAGLAWWTRHLFLCAESRRHGCFSRVWLARRTCSRENSGSKRICRLVCLWLPSGG